MGLESTFMWLTVVQVKLSGNFNPPQVMLLVLLNIQLISSNIFLPPLSKPSRECLSSTKYCFFYPMSLRLQQAGATVCSLSSFSESRKRETLSEVKQNSGSQVCISFLLAETEKTFWCHSTTNVTINRNH